jgi:hypothetical protein
MALQKFLNSKAATQVSVSGAGSPGLESSYFGPATKAAVMKFQTLNNVSAIGIVGPQTRAAIAAVCGNTTTNPGTPSGPGLTVSAGAQPANALAPSSAVRVPFTTFTITNNSGVVQTVNGITVQRVGLGVDANLDGVVLVDATNNIQLGISKTLNSNHQATVGDTFTINPGETKTLTVAGNIAAAGTAQSGQIVSLQVIAVNSTAAVSGVLPINGASHTINTTLSLGSYTIATSSFDPNINQTKSIGDTNVRFSGIRFTAGSAEDVKLYSIRWRQAGTASASDLGNVVTNANGVAYPTMVSTDGKYYTTTFPGGITITKGNSIDVYIQGNITGSNVSGRTVDFDIDRSTDVYFVGQTYGYGVTGPNVSNQPWFSGNTTTINPGSASTISRASEVGAQNIAINVSAQPLGAFATDFTGEAVSAQTMTFTIATTSGVTGLLTDVTLTDANGVVKAGPVDATWSSSGAMTVRFTDTVTFPTGRQVWTLKGKIPAAAASGATVQVTVNPSTWTNVQGQTSGSNISIGSGFDGTTLSQMTVQGASLTLSMSSQPASQNITASQTSYVFARPVLDASGSGEDVRLSNLKIRVIDTASTTLSGCQLFDGSTALNIGGNVISSPSTAADNTFVFDNPLVITKGTVKTLDLKCNLNGGSGSYQWTFAGTGSVTATGVTSGNSLTVTGSGSAGTMAIGTASIAVSVSPSSPSYAQAAAGQTGVTLGVVNFRAENEALTLKRLGLSFGSGTRDAVSQVYIYDGATQVGTVTFTGTVATSSLMNVTLPAGSDKALTVKADLASITTGNVASVEGVTVKLNPVSAEVNSPSTGTIQTGATGTVAGVRIYKSFPTIAMGPAAPANPNGSGQVLKKFSVTANNAGSINLNKFAFSIASSSGVTVTNLKLIAYTDSGYSNAANVPGTTSGLFGATVANTTSGATVVFSQSNNSNSALQVGASQTVYFALVADVSYSGSGSAWTITSTLLGDSSEVSAGTAGATQATSNFVWSPNATTTSASTTNDWFNGAGVTGLPSTGL